jgi:uncharacterized protein YydD (DUF2326 family)
MVDITWLRYSVSFQIMRPKSLTKPPAIRILAIREQKVVLDSDLAAIYGVTTGRFNEAVKRNLKRFPEDFSFVLTAGENSALRSQIAILGRRRDQLISQNAISKPRRGGRTKLPRVFTEHGALMAASILNSERAIAMSIYVIRAFVELRDRLNANAAVLKHLGEIDHELLLHDAALRDIYEKLQPLLAPPPEPVRPQIGFSPLSKRV